MKLYSGPLSMFGAKAEIAAIEKQLDIEVVHVGFSLDRLYEPKHAEIKRVNPKQQVPVLVDGSLEIFDSTQIFEYFEDCKPSPALWPAEPKLRAQARLLELKSDEVFFSWVINLMPKNRAGLNQQAIDHAVCSIEQYQIDMNQQLVGQDYLVGGFSFADIAFYNAQFFAQVVGVPVPEGLASLADWRARMAARNSVSQVMGAMAVYLLGIGLSAPALA